MRSGPSRRPWGAVVVALCVALAAPGAWAQAPSSPGPARAKPNGARFFGWEVEARTLSGGLRPTTLIVEVRDGSEARDGGAIEVADERRYRITAAAGGRHVVERGARLTMTLDARVSQVDVHVVDRFGGTWRRVVEPQPQAQTTITLTSQWTAPIYRGAIANATQGCGRGAGEIVRVQVMASSALGVGDEVVVRPGRSAAGPPLPPGDYELRVELQDRGRWRKQRSRRVVVADAPYRWEIGCPER